jgi:anaerobic magnesium-protoporphyrin IX monomethyl ester cyclase
MRILLIIPPVIYARQPSIGVAYLSSYLKDKGYDVKCWDLNTEIQVSNDGDDAFWSQETNAREFFAKNKGLFENWVDKILSYNAQIIGFSVWLTSQYSSLRLAEMIKAKDKNKLIVFGGAGCSFTGKKLIANSAVDIAVLGEGERVLEEIIKKYINDGKVESCPGCLIKRNGEIINCGSEPEINNLDELPFPDFSDFSIDKYLYSSHMPISFSRGCIWRCAFCDVPFCWKKFRSRSARNIYSEIKYRLTGLSAKEFIVCDPSLNANLSVLSELCDLIISNNLRIKFNGLAQIRPEMDFDFLEKLKKAGCELLDYGVESGAQNVLDKMGKKYKVEDAERVIKETYNAGIKVILNLVVGFPNETEEDFYKTLEFIKRIKDYVLFIAPGHACLILPYSYMYKYPDEFDIILDKQTNCWSTKDGKNNEEVRLKRVKIFNDFITDLGIVIRCGEDDREMESEKLSIQNGR